MVAADPTPEHVPIGTPFGYDTLSHPSIPTNVQKALKVINSTYDAAWAVLYGSDSDPHRLRMHSKRLILRVLPITQAMERDLANVENGLQWLMSTIDRISELVLGLEEAASRRSDER